MKYMLMLFDNEDWWSTATEQAIGEEMERHGAFVRHLEAQGMKMLGGEALQASLTATTLRGDGDQLTITDGPFVELKEQLGGYYLIEAPSMDDMVEAAKHCPLGSGIEIRQVPENYS